MRFDNKWHDYCTFCDMFRRFYMNGYTRVITSVTFQLMTNWRVTTVGKHWSTIKDCFGRRIQSFWSRSKKIIFCCFHALAEHKRQLIRFMWNFFVSWPIKKKPRFRSIQINANLVILATPVRIISYQVVSLGYLGGFVAF